MAEDIIAAQNLLNLLANPSHDRSCFNILGVTVPKQRRDRLPATRKPTTGARQPRRAKLIKGHHITGVPTSQWASYMGLQQHEDKYHQHNGSQGDLSGAGASETTALHNGHVSDSNPQSQLQRIVDANLSSHHASSHEHHSLHKRQHTGNTSTDEEGSRKVARRALSGPRTGLLQVGAKEGLASLCGVEFEELQALRTMLLQGLALHLNGVKAAKAETQLQLLLYYLRFHSANPLHLRSLQLVEIVRQLTQHHNRGVGASAKQLLHAGAWSEVYNTQLGVV
jgi:hypothetical protein